MKLRRLGYALGAEITGLDLTKALDERTVSELQAAWLEHILLCFPGQDIGPAELSAFSRCFGELNDNRTVALYNVRDPEAAEVQIVVNKPVEIKGQQIHGLVADRWHTDLSATGRPAPGTFLHAVRLPEVGGDTLFANMYMAYDALSPTLQRIIEPLEGVHDPTLAPVPYKNADRTENQQPDASISRIDPERPCYVHPVVKVRPETGRKSLYLGFVRKFVGMTEEESRPLLEVLNQRATSYECTYRHRWSVNDVVMWDNRCTLHKALHDYDPRELRQMTRCSLLGPKSGYRYTPDADRAFAAVR